MRGMIRSGRVSPRIRVRVANEDESVVQGVGLFTTRLASSMIVPVPDLSQVLVHSL
jgi:hypothetical protein